MSEEHYRTLGISPDASRAEIEAAYKQRVKETHPDLNDDPNAADEFQRVKEARDALLGSGAGSPAGGAGAGSTAGAPGGPSSTGGGAGGGPTGDAAGRSQSGGGSRHETSTRTEEPTGDRTEGRGRSATGSGSRRSRGSATRGGDGRTGSGETSRTDAAGAESAGGSGRSAAGAAGAGSAGGRGGPDRSGREASAGTASRTRDYPRYRSVIEEPTGGRAAAYDRVVPVRPTPTRPTEGTTRPSAGVAGGLMTFPSVLLRQFLYSWMWAIVGVPLAVLYLYGVRGLYYGSMTTTSGIAILLGAIGVSFVKVRIGVMMSGVATIALAYFALIWHPDPSWLEVAIAFHLVPLYVVTALVAEYA